MLRLEQWLSGRDFARGDASAAQMINFIYFIGDDTTREALLVDPAWDIDGLVARVEREGYTLIGALASHYHPDHIGGEMMGWAVEGVARLREVRPDARIHCHANEVPWIERVTGLAASDLVAHADGDVLALGTVRVTMMHTPGHTPGSTCYIVSDDTLEAGAVGSVDAPAVLSGDTLFVQGCGRIDLPGSDGDEMFRTLSERFARLPESAVLHPGHNYGPTPTATLGEVRRTNPYLRVRSLEEWHALMA
jgi:glyoxylase-like metal-dependent hydrolase (beta-lactamase superfamily II)